MRLQAASVANHGMPREEHRDTIHTVVATKSGTFRKTGLDTELGSGIGPTTHGSLRRRERECPGNSALVESILGR